MVGGMVPPCGIAVSAFLFPRKFTKSEIRRAPVTLIMGLAFITEGALPYLITDIGHVLPCCMLEAGLAGALSSYDMSDTGSTISGNVKSALSGSLTAVSLKSIGTNAMAGLKAGINAGRSGVVSAMQSAALQLWSKDLVGNFAKAQATVYARAKDNGQAALGKWEG